MFDVYWLFSRRESSLNRCLLNEWIPLQWSRHPTARKTILKCRFHYFISCFQNFRGLTHPEPTFIFHGSLRSGFNADFQALSPAHCFPRPAPYCARCPATHGLLEGSAGQELSFSHLFPLTDLRCASAWSLLLLGSLSINFQPMSDATQPVSGLKLLLWSRIRGASTSQWRLFSYFAVMSVVHLAMVVHTFFHVLKYDKCYETTSKYFEFPTEPGTVLCT